MGLSDLLVSAFIAETRPVRAVSLSVLMAASQVASLGSVAVSSVDRVPLLWKRRVKALSVFLMRSAVSSGADATPKMVSSLKDSLAVVAQTMQWRMARPRHASSCPTTPLLQS